MPPSGWLSAETVCGAAAPYGPVVVSVGAESTRAAVAFAEHAASAGAAAVMAIPPLSARLGAAELEAYFLAILKATPLPLVVQDASSYLGGELSIDLLSRLHAHDPERICFKPEADPQGPRLSELLAATGGEAKVYDGSGGIALIDTYRRGVVGTMPGTDLCWSIVALWKLLQKGDLSAAYRLSQPLVALVAMQTSLDAYVAVEKHLLVRQGVFESSARREPVGYQLDELTITQVDAYFDLLREACDNLPGSGSGGARAATDR
jgi:dihydrodipicolinate synthase/N-acetylneuraminate lyase